MGTKKTETQTTIPPRGAPENSLLQLLQGLAQGSAGQLGDLSALAQGQIGLPTGQDLELIAQSIGRARQMAENQLQTAGNIQAAQAREDITARTGQGSSGEVLSSLLNTLGTQQGINQAILSAQQQGGQALLGLPFQRAQTQLSANQQLLQRILGATGPALQFPLQERLAQTTTTQEQSGMDLGALVKLGAMVAGTASGIPGLGFLAGAVADKAVDKAKE